MWSNEQIERWHQMYAAYQHDRAAVVSSRNMDLLRSRGQPEMVRVLNSFLDGTISLTAFDAAFPLKRTPREVFLHKLVKNIPNVDSFAPLFRLMLRAPDEEQDGQRRMQALVIFLESWIVSGRITEVHLRPPWAPFFLSAWWHVQTPQRWPVLTHRVRSVLLPGGGASRERQDFVENYFEFRRRFVSLAAELGISSWALEHLCFWYGQRGLGDCGEEESGFSHPDTDIQRPFPWEHVCRLALQTEGKRGEAVVKGFEEETPQQSVISYRTHVQWLLARIGKKVGCHVWIATSYHGKVYQRERLGDLSLTSLPVLAVPAFQRIIRQIDVLWLLDNEVIAAYEIERAHPDISMSLLRLYVLGALSGGHEVSLCVVASQDRFEKVRFELSRSAFHECGLRNRCTLISEEQLLQHQEHILRWASGLSVIKDLTGNLGVGEQR